MGAVAFSDLITFTRSTGGGRTNAQGQYEWLPANQPRIDYDPLTGERRGLLIEEQRTRLNLISAAPIAPQTVTVGASAQTISFFGSGSVDLTGAHTATLLGSGPFPARRTYTFTPSAGSLTITPTGDVRMLQVEAGAFATSPIIGEGSQVTRAADIATVNELSPWYNPEQGTLFVEWVQPAVKVGQQTVFDLNDGTTSNRIAGLVESNSTIFQSRYAVGGSILPNRAAPPAVPGTICRAALSYSAGAQEFAFNGAIFGTGAIAGTLGLVSAMRIGGGLGGPLNSHIRSIRYYRKRLIDDDLKALTK